MLKSAIFVLILRFGCSFVPCPSTHVFTKQTTKTWQLYDIANVKAHLADRYPMFDSLLLSKYPDLWKKLPSDAACTIFAPNEKAFSDLGDKKLGQLQDIRNEETVQKMASFHAVGERVTADELFNSGGVVTIGGVVPVGRSVKGGLFGIGGTEDGGVTLNGAKVTSTTEVDNCLIHEVDTLISPQILWRYCDQLRIPGSK